MKSFICISMKTFILPFNFWSIIQSARKPFNKQTKKNNILIINCVQVSLSHMGHLGKILPSD